MGEDKNGWRDHRKESNDLLKLASPPPPAPIHYEEDFGDLLDNMPIEELEELAATPQQRRRMAEQRFRQTIQRQRRELDCNGDAAAWVAATAFCVVITVIAAVFCSVVLCWGMR